MKIAVLGTGMVGQAHAGKLAKLGHQVFMGTNDVRKTEAKTKIDQMSRPGIGLWLEANHNVKLATFSRAAGSGDLVINALSGQVSLKILQGIKSNLDGKILIDIANPLDFSKGTPPFLSVSNTNSLGEQIQQALPKTLVVKAFNTTNASVQVDPHALSEADHHLFLAGDDKAAKTRVAKFAKQYYGWKNIIDLGDISSARGMEMVLPLWLEIRGSLNTSNFNFKIAR
jgi:NADPH-dependent F420 reductase